MSRNYGFSFVLTGKLQSDSLEKNFGWCRQLSGANYFISTRQLFKAENKIRMMTLLKSGFRFSVIKEHILPGEENISEDQFSLKDKFEVADLSTIDADDKNLTYVGGYIARVIVRKSNCISCKQLLLIM